MQVSVHVYDVTNAESANLNQFITRFNASTRGIGMGVFHGGIEVLGKEWSYGACPSGSGVYSCKPKSNPMYQYRETVPLGETSLDEQQIMAVIRRLKSQFPGSSYHLLALNCNTFCEALATELEVAPPPAWINRLAVNANAASVLSTNTANSMRDAAQQVSRTASRSWAWAAAALSGKQAFSSAAVDGGATSTSSSRQGSRRASGTGSRQDPPPVQSSAAAALSRDTAAVMSPSPSRQHLPEDATGRATQRP